jgi:uncharacterized protein YrrD
MTTLKELVGRPVVSRHSAETLGRLNGAVLDPSQHRIVAWQVGKGRKGLLIDHIRVLGIADALMVDDDSSARKPATPAERGTVKGSHAILGHRVLSDAGDDLGTVEDIALDVGSGIVTDLRTSVTEATGESIRGFGAFALVLGGPPRT